LKLNWGGNWIIRKPPMPNGSAGWIWNYTCVSVLMTMDWPGTQVMRRTLMEEGWLEVTVRPLLTESMR